MGDLKTDLSQLYIKAGLKNIGTVFLLTDAQVQYPYTYMYMYTCINTYTISICVPMFLISSYGALFLFGAT